MAASRAPLSISDVHRLVLGHFTSPDSSRLSGARIVVCAYLIRHPRGLVLYDTGIAEGHEEAERLYHPVRRSLPDALAAAGASVSEIDLLANCHLHLDHAGENFRFPGRPIFVQRIEQAAAEGGGLEYTLPSATFDFSGARWEVLDGEADVLPGIHVVPTPGHTPGHQALVLDTRQGRVVLAGQSVNDAGDYGRARYAWELHRSGEDPGAEFPPWLGRLQELDPWRVLFAHDTAMWQADPLSAGDGREAT